VRLGLFLMAFIGFCVLIGLSIPDRSPRNQPPAPSSPVPTSTAPTTAPAPPTRTLINRVPAGNVYSYENAAGETVEEMENRQGQLRLCCKNSWECEERLVSARYAANPNSWLMAWFWARISPLAIPSSWPLRSLCMAS
jgi:hypothetical protein